MEEQPRERRGTLLTFLLLMALVLVPFAQMVAPYLISLLMGGIIAVLTHPLYRRLRSAGWGPKTSSGIITGSFLVLVLAPLTLFTISAVRQSMTLISSLTNRGALTFENMFGWLLNSRLVRAVVGDPGEIQQQLRSSLTNAAQSVSGVLLNLAAGIPELLLQVALGLIATFFLLADGRRFFQWLADKIPLSPKIRLTLFSSFRNTAVSVVSASVAAAGAQSAVMLFTFLILGVPGAFLAAGATFIFAWIPILGSVPVVIVGAAYLFFEDQLVRMGIMIALGLLVGLSDNVVRSFVLQGRDEMHPLVSLVAMFGGLAMFGLTGVFIGPIFAAIVISVLDTWPSVARQYGITVGEPEDIEEELQGSKYVTPEELEHRDEVPPIPPDTRS